MSGFYKNKNEITVDSIVANSVKVFSVGSNGKCVPATDYEKQLHNEDKAAAITRLVINKAMSDK